MSTIIKTGRFSTKEPAIQKVDRALEDVYDDTEVNYERLVAPFPGKDGIGADVEKLDTDEEGECS